MRGRFLRSMITVAIAAAALSAILSFSITRTSAQAPASVKAAVPASASALKTPWGEPDLQGIWTDESDTPLQRSPKYANQEFFTEAQRAELDKERAALLGRDRRVEERAFAEGRGADPRTVDNVGGVLSTATDPLQ